MVVAFLVWPEWDRPTIDSGKRDAANVGVREVGARHNYLDNLQMDHLRNVLRYCVEVAAYLPKMSLANLSIKHAANRGTEPLTEARSANTNAFDENAAYDQ